MRLRRTALRASPRMNTFARPAEGAKDQKPKPKQDHKPNQKPLTLALPKRRTARRERGLIEVFVGDTPTWDTESNSDFESPQIGSLSLGRGLGGRRSDEGQIQHKSKAEHPLFTTQ
jgi:hypothetical protein